MTDPVEAVLFDIDDTICEYRRSGEEILAVAFDRVGVDPFFDVTEYIDRYREFTDESEDMQDLRERCFAAFARERGEDPATARAVAQAYADERDHTDVRFRTGARETLDVLDGEVRLAAVTNGGPGMQSTKLDALGIADRFETVVHAGYDAPSKPSPEPFYEALSTIGVEPAAALHVGNSLRSDVAGAQAAGVRSAWLTNGVTDPDPEPDYVLESMEELADRLWE